MSLHFHCYVSNETVVKHFLMPISYYFLPRQELLNCLSRMRNRQRIATTANTILCGFALFFFFPFNLSILANRNGKHASQFETKVNSVRCSLTAPYIIKVKLYHSVVNHAQVHYTHGYYFPSTVFLFLSFSFVVFFVPFARH